MNRFEKVYHETQEGVLLVSEQLFDQFVEENESLREGLEDWKQTAFDLYATTVQLREALQFYAIKETYEQEHQYYGDGNVETFEEPIVDDKGAIARQALEGKS